MRRHLARSRQDAADLIHSGRVLLDGMVVTKPARQMDPAQALIVAEGERDDYVSRGAHKLIGALEYLGERCPTLINSVRALDAGASRAALPTCSCGMVQRRSSRSTSAASWREVCGKIPVSSSWNAQTCAPCRRAVAPAPELVVGDLSFISLTLVIPALARCASERR